MTDASTTLQPPRTARAFARAHADARARTLALLDDLDEELWAVPQLEIVNPFCWELSHVAWFQERWILRHLGARPPLRADGDALFDSAAVHHASRWTIPLPSCGEARAYAQAVLEGVQEVLEHGELDEQAAYFHALVLGHEDMHGEAFAMMRQTLGYAAPNFAAVPRSGHTPPPAGRADGGSSDEVDFEGGLVRLGRRHAGFAFDNEAGALECMLAPFRLDASPVSQGAFEAFVQDDGYRRDELWTAAGRAWREATGAERPHTWKRADGQTWRRSFDRWLPLEPELPVVHVNAHEAEAYCRWSSRRLPTEAEWECAAGTARFPWGDAPPTPARARLELTHACCAAPDACDPGASPAGVRHLIGNVWEWTATPFRPYPGFEPGPYLEYSAPWFETHRVLRGGSFATRARLIHGGWRNFYLPERNDVFAGFRTARDA